jgi:hypothetical protein
MTGDVFVFIEVSVAVVRLRLRAHGRIARWRRRTRCR